MRTMNLTRTAAVAAFILAGFSPMVAQTGSATITLSTTPSPPGVGQNRFDAVVRDASGQPVTNADVVLVLVMPANPKTKHPEMRTEGKLSHLGAGKYNGIAVVGMAGTWHATVTASVGGKAVGQTKTTLTAQMPGQGGTSAPKPAAAQHDAHTHTHPAAAALKNPMPGNAESAQRGQGVFAKQCATCHGSGGKGDGSMAAKLKQKPADLTDAEWKHGPSDGEIFTLIRDGAKNAGMKAYRGALTEQQMWDLVNYIRSIGPVTAAR